ncbi:MAG: hypothetical protein E7613_02120 [Ruminococcaceae bacterium]|nr:hypothetical protein [Oscillospiraceae bacterium]
MTDIIFSFDTEDFTSNTAANAIYREAEILRREGVRGGFCIVGLLAKHLVEWGREDVLEALKYHDIGLHTLGHSLHPTINEYTDIESFDDAHTEFLRQEREAAEYVKKATGRYPIFGCPPGNQKTYVGMYGYSDMDIPIYADTYCDTVDGEGTFYCNIYQTQYTFTLEKFLQDDSDEFMRNALDDLAKYKRAILFTHPNIAIFSEFWDILNYKEKNLCEFGKWKEGKKRPEEETERYYKSIERFIKMIKADGRFNITSYSAVAEAVRSEEMRVVKKADIPFIKESLEKNFFPIREPMSLSVSDIFLACVDFLKGKDEHVCGKVYGFLDTPLGVTDEVTLSAADVKKAAETLDVSGFLPEKIKVGGTDVGPADFLRAALQVLCGEEYARIKPDEQLPSLDILPKVKNVNFKSWIIVGDDFKDNYLSKRLKLQIWTLRFKK